MHQTWCCRQLERAMSDTVSAIAATDTAKPTGVRWKIFLLMLFLISINYIDRASLSVAMPLISKEFDIDPAWQGVILSSFFWTYAFCQLLSGWLVDNCEFNIVTAPNGTVNETVTGRVIGGGNPAPQRLRPVARPCLPVSNTECASLCP